MSDRQAFIRRICEEPFEDTHRLVFADWLDEVNDHDQAHQAAYIRHAILDPCEGMNAVPPHHGNQGESADVYARAEPTVTQITGRMAHEGEAWSARRWYDRGFVYRVGLPVLEFLKHARRLFENHPITEVELYDRQAQHYYGSRTGQPAAACLARDGCCRNALSSPVLVCVLFLFPVSTEFP
jgi:uncharacterized protein (TIGR02996 family)